MYGVALEGGGMKGAYHLGAMKAIYECGYEIGGFVGTSIGSFNAAVLAQGDFEKLYNIWHDGSATMGLDLKENELIKLVSKKIDIAGVKYWTKLFSDSIANKGMDTAKLKALYDKYIDEERLRNSSIDYGMVTVSLTDRKPVYLFKEDIPEGEVSTYVLASSYLPVFKQDKILKDDKIYIDGGFYDNCPITLLKKKGYKDIIEIRTRAIGISRKIDRKGLNITTITPSKELGGILLSDNNVVRRDMQMGYFDALRVLKGYAGDKFYVIPTENEKVFKAILNLTNEQILNMISGVKMSLENNMEPKKILFEKILPLIQTKLKGKDTSTYQKAVISMIEYLTEDELKVYKLYTFEELLTQFKKKIPKLLKKEKDALIKNNTNILMLKLLKYIEI